MPIINLDQNSYISIEDVCQVASGSASVSLSEDQNYIQLIKAGAQFIEKLLKEDGVVYGVTTGYGDSCTVEILPELIEELPLHLTRYHGCGLGKYLDKPQVLAVMFARLISLSKGYSGVSLELVQLLSAMINRQILPQIPEEGSVGASGDLTPLSYIAGALVGERQVKWQEQQVLAKEAFAATGLTPIKLKPKEGLAVMNGTAVMTGLACLAYQKAEYLAKLATRLTAMASLAIKGNANHFDEYLFNVKPHQGQQKVAARIRHDLNYERHPSRNSERLQDRYSIRCAPHVIGVLEDALPLFRTFIENELNSSNDNPIIDSEHQKVLHGGHFYGGHIAFAMDSMKNTVANLADLLDRQLALLVDTRYNNGLPSNLSGAETHRSSINHGFKAVQISVSAWTAEALKLTMPASVFSRSTECHNQDKVSMGTISTRDCLRVIELTQQVFAAHLLALYQALKIRLEKQELATETWSAEVLEFYQAIEQEFDWLTEDRILEQDLRKFVALIDSQAWELYEE
ncbi:MAG: aromatic amino acid lyase [Gammaproteobacteria bacterium]|nr:aromatic amino acid lyase [Gammaproteobacteria bacterium]